MCHITVVNGPYVWYLPLFVHQLQKAYPEYELHILADTEETDILSLKGVRKFDSPKGEDSGYRAACLRFLHSDETLEGFDYCLITDCDMMIVRESLSIVDQHMLDLRKNNLQCYSNYTSMGNKCPGIHFVTKEWWSRTAVARGKEKDAIDATKNVVYDHDEKMLRRLIIDSHLPTPPDKINPWTYHGEHLGDWRRRVLNKDKNSNYNMVSAVENMKRVLVFMEKMLWCTCNTRTTTPCSAITTVIYDKNITI